MNLLEEHAKDIIGSGEWEAIMYECLPLGEKTQVYHLQGEVKSKIDKQTRDVYFTPKDHEGWLQNWEKETGKCSKCCGEGKIIFSVSAKETKCKACPKCNGSGVVKSQAEEKR